MFNAAKPHPDGRPHVSRSDYDFRERLPARHIGRHLPGEPAIVAVNVPVCSACRR
jgi:hypothetical protein